MISATVLCHITTCDGNGNDAVMFTSLRGDHICDKNVARPRLPTVGDDDEGANHEPLAARVYVMLRIMGASGAVAHISLVSNGDTGGDHWYVMLSCGSDRSHMAGDGNTSAPHHDLSDDDDDDDGGAEW